MLRFAPTSKRPWGVRKSVSDLMMIPVPPATATYSPVPQQVLFDGWSDRLVKQGYTISDEEHWVSADEQRFISKVTVVNRTLLSDDATFSWQFALINSYDRQVAINTLCGAKVFVCTNGCMDAEWTSKTKHTSGVWNRLDQFLNESVANIHLRANAIKATFDVYRNTGAESRSQVDHVVCEAYRNNVIASSGIGQVLDHWERPEHAEFKPRNLWSLYNAFTSYNRGRSEFEESSRINKLNRILRKEFNLDILTPQEVADNM